MHTFDSHNPNLTVEDVRKRKECLPMISVSELLTQPRRQALIEAATGERFALRAVRRRYQRVYYLGMLLRGVVLTNEYGEDAPLEVKVLEPSSGLIMQGRRLVLWLGGEYDEVHTVRHLTIC